jgi:hypothetical protein
VRVTVTAVVMTAALAGSNALAGEALISADQRARPPSDVSRSVHGEARMGVGVGFIADDPMASVEPSLALDLRDILPLQLRFGGPLRLRLYDRSPRQGEVVRGADWDEAGDFVAILEALNYVDSFAFGAHGQADFDLRIGSLGRVQLGHGSLVMGYANGLDLDRRRSGLDFVGRLEGALLERRAGVEMGLVVGDLAGSGIFGGRVGADWAGAGIGFSVVGDPSAPRQLDLVGGGITIDRHNRPVAAGDRGVAAIGLDLSYRFTDRWRYLITPYLDLNLMPGLGKGLHLGVDAEMALGRRHAARLGIRGEMTASDRGYDPAYFDVFYGSQRWQVPFVGASGALPADLSATALPKAGFVATNDLSGVGGYGGIRFAHDDGVFMETGYRYRPGPLGHSWETRVGVESEVVRLSILLAHRGRMGFRVIDPSGTLASAEVAVPVLRHLDVTGRVGWLFAVRRVPGASAAALAPSTGYVGGAGIMLLGVAGRFPW